MSNHLDLTEAVKAISNNDLEALKMQLDIMKVDPSDVDIQSTLCGFAAGAGSLELLKYLRELNYAWSSITCRFAAENGRLDCLRYLHENGCDWTFQTTEYAAKFGHLECLKYAHENGCYWDNQVTALAAKFGHLECLKYAHEQGCEWRISTTADAASGGHLECLKYAHENGCPWDEQTTSDAAEFGHLECLKYAIEHGCPLDYWTVHNAVEKGHLACLKYVHEQGYVFTSHTGNNIAYVAAGSNQAECLKYVHEHGCEWNAKQVILFTLHGPPSFECFKYCTSVWGEDKQGLWDWLAECSKQDNFKKNQINIIIKHIDIDQPEWRYLLTINVKRFSKLLFKVRRFKEKLRKVEKVFMKHFHTKNFLITKDIIKYYLLPLI